MTAFKDFEREVVTILSGPHMDVEQVSAVLDGAEFVSCDHTRVGYFLTVRHPALPVERQVYDSPLLIGGCGELECGFVIFLENGELTLECHSWDGSVIPEDIRDREVKIERAP